MDSGFQPRGATLRLFLGPTHVMVAARGPRAPWGLIEPGKAIREKSPEKPRSRLARKLTRQLDKLERRVSDVRRVIEHAHWIAMEDA